MDRELLRSITEPTHYESEAALDVIDFCQMYNISFTRGNIIKYIVRAGKKNDELQDLHKALDYLLREIEYLKNKQS